MGTANAARLARALRRLPVLLVLLAAPIAAAAASGEKGPVRIDEAWQLACPLIAHMNRQGCDAGGVQHVFTSARSADDGSTYYIVVLRPGPSLDHIVYRVDPTKRDVTFVDQSSDIDELQRRYR